MEYVMKCGTSNPAKILLLMSTCLILACHVTPFSDRHAAITTVILVRHAEKVLRRIGFIEGDSTHIRLTLVDMLSRLDPASREIAILRGILSRIEYCLDRKDPDRDDQ